MPLELYEWQEQDVAYLLPKRGRLIANQMGTGKTLEGVALDQDSRALWAQEHGPVLPPTLVVAPIATFDGWEYVYNDLAPDLRVQVIDPKNRGAFVRAVQSHRADVYIAHWEGVWRMPELQKVGWLHILADEVHLAKGRNTKRTKGVKRMTTVFKTGLSGTPFVNHPHELWSVLHWLYPQYFRSYWKFYNEFCEWHRHPVNNYRIVTGVRNPEKFRNMIRPFTIRRLKKDVLTSLPEKYYTTIHVQLTPRQRRDYKAMKEDMLAFVGDGSRPLAAPVAAAKWMRLQQMAISEVDVVDGHIVHLDKSPKLDAVMSFVEDAGLEYKDSDDKVVVYSQFKGPLRLLQARMEKTGIPAVLYTGDESYGQRRANKDRFISGDAKAFLATIGAGGVGLDGLQGAAHTAIFIDRDDTPGGNEQAEDRLHRDGQKNAVQIVDIVARGTVDVPRGRKVELKASWIRQTLGG